MPAYVHHHETEMAPVLCPGCIGPLPMYVREVEPHWSNQRIDLVYECADCGAEVRQTVRRPPLAVRPRGEAVRLLDCTPR